MTLKKGNQEIETVDENEIENDTPIDKNITGQPNKLPYSVIAAYDGLFLDKNDMDSIYSELKNLKANIKRTNMENIKTILTKKLNIELPTTRKYQLEHLTLPYTNDQITSNEIDDERKRNLIILQYYLDILCYGYSIYLTKWQCSSWFNIFKETHEKFIAYLNTSTNSSTYRSQCLNIFKNELFYYCNPRTVTLYLKENENNKNKNDNSETLNLNNDNLEEVLMANRYVKPGIFDSILPPKEENVNLSSQSINTNRKNSLSKKSIQSRTNNNSIDITNNNNNSNVINSVNSLKYSKNSIMSNYDNELNSNDDSYTSDEYDEYDDEEEAINKDFYIFEYNIPRTFNSLQIECLIRFFLKTYIQHINIIAYVFSHPQENIFMDYSKTIVPPVIFEELEHGIIAEEWPNWVQEQENILIKKKEEEEAAIELERKKKEEEMQKEKERLEEELAKQKLKEAQDNIINSLLSLLYQPSDKNISELPVIPPIKTEEENNNIENEQENDVNEDTENNNVQEINKDNEEEDNNATENNNEDDIQHRIFNISNPKFRNSFLDLWKKQVIEREQQQKELVDQLNYQLKEKNENLELEHSEQSLLRLENSRQELINKIKEITGDDDEKKIRDVYDPEKVETIIQNSELLKDQYFTQLQKHIEEVITTNIQHIAERIDNVNGELEKLRNPNDEKNNPPNKKDKKGEIKKEDKKAAAQSKKENTKKKEKPKKK